ncbi:hypothetical protein BJ170DRAFT_701926 [Xylariales sp. AK1849]|nr:hypothetical protein BJ170DRAFT_701926 [Xylariales sp. AK1849]
MTTAAPIVFYDIASGPPVRCFAPNPWKTRYALNFKRVAYRTERVELPEVTAVRRKLGAEPVRFFDDGTPFFTLPVIQDLSTGSVVGDSFDIALYLEKTYPDGPSLFPPKTVGLHAAFNAQVDAAFSQGFLLFGHGLPFNPETAEVSKAEFLRRSGATSWDALTVAGEERKQALETYRAGLGELAKAFKRTDGPFLEGESASYADLIVGGWLAFVKETVPEWDQVQAWHDGIWGKLHAALERYSEDK